MGKRYKVIMDDECHAKYEMRMLNHKNLILMIWELRWKKLQVSRKCEGLGAKAFQLYNLGEKMYKKVI